jgi:oxygen-independent coproporphyrinogen-3 oxidase
MMVGLYIHIAFCRTKCYYCDFNTYAGLDRLVPRYVEALATEIATLPQALPGAPRFGPVDLAIGSIFFGGGTPSLLSPEQIATVLEAARRFPVADDAEVTLEANPDDRSLECYRAIRDLGVNRLSLGVQSFDDAMLRRLGRRHDGAAAVAAVEQARQAGFTNLSLDLMFGLPGQTLGHWEKTIDRALDLAPEHLSLYNLTIEDETTFGRWAAAGNLTVPDDDATADMYQAAIDRLGTAGYVHYEISNWARPGSDRDQRAQHNLRYWRNQPYLGVGAGAHSSFGGYRFADVRAPARYVARLEKGETPVDVVERIDRPLEMAETMLLGLRLAEGIDVASFRDRFGQAPVEVYGAVLAELTEYGLIEASTERIALTDRGRFLGNEVFSRFLPDPPETPPSATA